MPNQRRPCSWKYCTRERVKQNLILGFEVQNLRHVFFSYKLTYTATPWRQIELHNKLNTTSGSNFFPVEDPTPEAVN